MYVCNISSHVVLFYLRNSCKHCRLSALSGGRVVDVSVRLKRAFFTTVPIRDGVVELAGYKKNTPSAQWVGSRVVCGE